MNKDEQIEELAALLEQERAYANLLKSQNFDYQAAQRHMVSGLEVWKAGFEKLYHENHALIGTPISRACSICLREHQFTASELTEVSPASAI